MGMFDNIAKDAENITKTDGAPFIGVGKYDLRVDEVVMGTSNKNGKNYILMNLTVLDVLEGAAHAAGDSVKWMTMGLPSKMNKDVARLLIGMLGIEASQITPDHAEAFVKGQLNGSPFKASVVDDSFQIKDKQTKELVFNEDGSKKMFNCNTLYGERALTKEECKDYEISEEVLKRLD